MKINIFTAGGTIDKVYFDTASDYKVGESTLHELFREANVGFTYEIESLLRKDSLEMTDADREIICEKVRAADSDRVLVTHGTDTMADTAAVLAAITGKTIVLTGAMQPARLKASDAAFNVGYAMAAVQILPSGVYIAMNGCVFNAGNVRKNRQQHRFETLN